MERAEAHPSVLLGSAASLPAVFGSLSNTIFAGKLPTNAGWQPALPELIYLLANPNAALVLQSL
jgi:hypothetical protein